VLLNEPKPTAYDLRWRMFGTDVRVHPLFWLVAILFGWGSPHEDGALPRLIIWVACMFLSILIHEFGHVLMGRLFGTRGHIILYGMGGLAVGSSALPNRWKRIAVYFAGPLAGFILALAAAVALIAVRVLDTFDLHPLLDHALWVLVGINIFWGILNLFPIWPLDGGQISRDFLGWISPARGIRISLGISFTVAGLLAINSLAAMAGRPLIPFWPFGGVFSAILFGLLALESYQAMQMEESGEARPWERRDPWE
jgi:Zn-dependent protease